MKPCFFALNFATYKYPRFYGVFVSNESLPSLYLSVFEVFSEDGSLKKEFEHRIVNGNKLVAQIRSHVFNKKESSVD